MVACMILLVFNGVGPFLESPFDTRRFIASYIGVRSSRSDTVFPPAKEHLLTQDLQIPVFIFLVLGYKIKKHGFRVSHWGPERSCDLRNTIQANSEKRKGRLEFPDNGFTKENTRTFVEWIWVWMK